ncbi:hypothetical protein PUN28_009121 [Cardiocondyla obscurior]|uniref:SEFIR domain-containing protein n=1 Tax=Cardiocondyla obscurior TaxID=286306 RepID=A0AAW2FS18_9HYME
MYSVVLLLLFLNIQTGDLWPYKKSIPCTYNFKQIYQKKTRDNDTTVEYSNYSNILYCPPEEISLDNVIYILNLMGNNGVGHTDFLRVEFPPPKRECMYGVSLLINPSIQDEKKCLESSYDVNKGWYVHGTERHVCVFKHDNPFVKSEVDLTNLWNKERVGVWFEYIFKGCYALRFNINANPRYRVTKPKFFNTNYQQMEVKEPELVCRYNARPNPEKSQMTNFTLNISIPPDTGTNLRVALISQQNKDFKKGCIWQGEPQLFTWTIDLRVTDARKELIDKYCNVKFMETVKGTYEKRIRCFFQIETEATSSCFMYNLLDDRCALNTVWKPPKAYGTLNDICLWFMQCEPTYEHWRHVEIIQPRTLDDSDTLLSASSYLLLPIIAIILIVSAVTGVLCYRRYLHIRQEEINYYVTPSDDSNCYKSINNTEKEICHPPCDDIVLLYTNSSTSFMGLMKDFRKALAKMCSCSVHDWHDGGVWNEVAKVGAVSWFTELLNNGCRVVWIDTPATRYAIISNSRNGEINSDKLSKYCEIHDFRDMAFHSVLEVAKNKMNDVASQYRRHFVVRFEGLESTANVDDPFLDLSPHARYYMPRHLMHLCSDLSVAKPEIYKCKTKIDEDVYRIFVYQLYKSQTQQRLKFMKMDSML